MSVVENALLVLNAGSSSLKFTLFAIKDTHQLERIFYGQIESLNADPKILIKNHQQAKLIEKIFDRLDIKTDKHIFAFNVLMNWLSENAKQYKICAAGHRVVHGGEKFLEPIVVNQKVIADLEIFIPLAPLHQPHNISGIKALSEYAPDLFQVACFDTTFHTTQSDVAKMYALPQNISNIPIKRYGFHGLSYEYITQKLPEYLGSESAKGKVIIAHLGYGASLCAVLNQKSIATTMGLTALEGLPMGTRSGSVDPGIILYLLSTGMSVPDVTKLLYEKSGLLGVSGVSGDVRTLLESKELSARKAINLFVYRIQCEIGTLVAALDGLDHLVFTAGIGENSDVIRAYVCDKLNWLNVKLDEKANINNEIKISSNESKVSVWVIPTNEEIMIAQHTLKFWNNR